MSVLFRTRGGQTPVDESIRIELIPPHVQDMKELFELEAENIALGIAWTNATSKDHLDYSVWIDVHKHMYNEVWKFAGKIKKTPHANDDFKLPHEVRPELLQLERDLKFWLQHKTYSPKETMAIFHEKLLTIHPFRDGNGRWARVVTEFVCRRQGIDVPRWKAALEDDALRRERYIAAVKKARRDFDYSELILAMW